MGDVMKSVSRFKIDKLILIPLIIFSIVSIITIYSAQSLLPSSMSYLALKQGIWYIVGFIIMFLIISLGNEFIYKKS